MLFFPRYAGPAQALFGVPLAKHETDSKNVEYIQSCSIGLSFYLTKQLKYVE